MCEISDEITEHIYYERGKAELNRKEKKVDLWQKGYDKGFEDAQEILSKKFEKMIAELIDKQKDKTD